MCLAWLRSATSNASTEAIDQTSMSQAKQLNEEDINGEEDEDTKNIEANKDGNKDDHKAEKPNPSMCFKKQMNRGIFQNSLGRVGEVFLQHFIVW